MKPKKLALLLLALAHLPGCASTRVQTVVSSKPFCRAMKHVCIKDADVLTDETATEIEGNNLGRAPICGKPKPCKQKG
jgi:hypothetical protein